MISHDDLVYIFLNNKDMKHIFLCLLAIFIHSLQQYVWNHEHIFIGFLSNYWIVKIHFIYMYVHAYVHVKYVNIFSQWVCLLFHFNNVFWKASVKVLIKWSISIFFLVLFVPYPRNDCVLNVCKDSVSCFLLEVFLVLRFHSIWDYEPIQVHSGPEYMVTVEVQFLHFCDPLFPPFGWAFLWQIFSESKAFHGELF